MGGGQLRALLPPGTFSHLRALPPPKKTRLRQTEPCDWWVGTPSAQPGGGWSGQHLAGLQPPILRALFLPVSLPLLLSLSPSLPLSLFPSFSLIQIFGYSHLPSAALK